MKVSTPSKTFLFGEYGILKSSPAVLINTNPRFELNVDRVEDQAGKLTGIDLESPAGRFYQIHHEFFSGFSLSFVDPWNGSGGFGASSSQFVMLFTLQKLLTQSDIQSQNYEFLNQLRNTYREIASGASGLPPSGADVISQWMGGLTYLDISSNQVENIGWGFPHLSFALIKTKNKLATHKHLATVEDVDDAEYALIAKRGQAALKSRDERNFVLAVQAQYQVLSKSGYVADETEALIGTIRNSGLTLASKGCGAMGADVLFTVMEKGKSDAFRTWAEQNDLNVVATEADLSHGIQISEAQS